MQKREELMKRLNVLRINPSNEELEMLISFGKEIKNEKQEMVNPTLSLELKRLGTLFFSKDIDSNMIIEFISRLRNKCSQISVKEVKWLFQEIIDNKTDINNYFKLSEVFRIIDNYLDKKQRVSKVSFELRQEEKKFEAFANDAFQFLQDAMAKFEKGEKLSIYEKCAIGKRHEFEIKGSEELKEKAINELSNENEKIANKHKTEYLGLFVDPELDIPVFWTVDLLYRSYLFEAIEKNKMN